MVEKKVIAVIVEGPSDESAIGGILKEYFCSEEVQFAVVHGDITSDYRTTVVNVVENELKPFSDDEKEIMSDEFAEKYEGKAAEFIKYISKPDIAVKGTYKETWKFIQKDNNSLCRNSNMHLIFNNK